MNTFNLRKFGDKDRRPNLLTNPRDWLEEVCGTLDILNRSDMRLGMDTHDDDVKVIRLPSWSMAISDRAAEIRLNEVLGL